MSRFSSDGTAALGGLPRPGIALKSVMIGLVALWAIFAIGLNWAGLDPKLFYLFCGNTEQILAGQIWRLFTAPVMHAAQGNISHVLWTVLGLYFLAPTLEQKWGPERMLRFLFFSGVIAYALQALFLLAVPTSLAAKLANPHWFGAFPVVEAVAIAWALTFKGQTVKLFFILPVTSRGLILIVVGGSVLYVIAGARPPAGLVSPFGGMIAGWLLGGSTPSPLRRAYLSLRLAQIERETTKASQARRKRVEGSGLRVIEGGKDRSDEPSDSDRGPDGKWLN